MRPETIAGLGYRVAGVLGRGASGVVLAATDAEGREVALKVLEPGSPFAPRFRREVRLLLGHRHPHLVEGLAAHEAEGVLVMERVPARSLQAELAGGARLGPEHALALLAQVGSALAALHAARVWHRDVKPGNALYDPRARRAWLADLGLAKDLDALTRHTEPGQVMGTLAYAPPELFTSEGSAAAGDVYSLGATTFRLLAGRPPFVGKSPLELTRAVVYDEPPELRLLCPGIPRELASLVEESLSKDAAARPAAVELAERAQALGGRVWPS
ncbi:MAG: serine/threonine-protein kinase [Planctomycetota bacterium]